MTMMSDQYPPCKPASVGGAHAEDRVWGRGSIAGKYSRPGGMPGGTPKSRGVSCTRDVACAKFEEPTPGIFSTPEKACSQCGAYKPRTLDWFPSDSRKRDGLRAECRVCASARTLRAYAAKRGEDYRPSPAHRTPRPPLIGGYKAEAKPSERRPNGRSIADRLRERIRQAIGAKAKGHYSLGCTTAELKRHIERQFLKGMSWENRQDWHVDHIRPLASFDLTDPEQLRAACHFTNLRPLWARDNLRKGATCEVLL